MLRHVPIWAAVVLAALAVAQPANADGDRRGGGHGHGHGGIPKPIETDPCIEYAEGSGNTEFDDYWQPHEIDRAVRKLGRKAPNETEKVFA